MSFEYLRESCIPITYVPLLKVCRQGGKTIQTAHGEGEIIFGNDGVEIVHKCIKELYKENATFE
jgi:hypothetical protein